MKKITNNCPIPGWKRMICQRKTGKTSGKFDVYFVEPNGKRLRSRREISSYLEENGLDVSLDLFCFRTGKNFCERTLTNVKEKKKESQVCSSATKSCYFSQEKLQSENSDVSMGVGGNISVKKKFQYSEMEPELAVEKPERIRQSQTQIDKNTVQQDKRQTSPYFKKNCLSSAADHGERVSFEPWQGGIVNLPPKGKILKDFESSSSGTPKCSSPESEFPNCYPSEPLRMNIFDKKERGFLQTETSTIVRFPDQGLISDFDRPSLGLANRPSSRPALGYLYETKVRTSLTENPGLVKFPIEGGFSNSSKTSTVPDDYSLEKMEIQRKERMANQPNSIAMNQQIQPAQITDEFQHLPPGLQRFHSLRYTAPKSPFNLIQEKLCHDPWKLLVATIFLNKTKGCNAIPILWKFFDQFPNAAATTKADPTEIEDMIQSLGLFRKRARILKRFSTEYLCKAWQYPNELHGIGKYGNDSFRMFCLGECKDVLPDDHKLNLYHTWLCEPERKASTIAEELH
ncbi:uncharacterized protein LOC114520836 [Dendronephthya gigantea]|uniref:uncharacterized protein LOC114520836 n=1 Tax=Dendronephthya gigantea TaxID=151771 RepID=UPI00106D94F0|nr:uncharacterized protein LOC114520836 [Dendronephthya gigantea]